MDSGTFQNQPPLPPPLPPTERSAGRVELKIPTATRNWFLSLLGVHSVLELGAIAASAATVQFIERARAGEEVTHEEGEVIDAATSLIALGQTGVYLVLVVLFCVWFHRIVANAKQLNPNEGPSPGWAVGSFFVPILCLFRPYQAAAYAWTTTARAAHAAETPPRSTIVGGWWVVWILVNFVSNVYLRLTLPQAIAGQTPSLDELARIEHASIGISLLSLVLNVLCAVFMHRLTAMQQQVQIAIDMYPDARAA